jgi:acyl transferase domain-containing protein
LPGVSQNFVAAQVAQYFNFTGPNMVVDTACSSSLVSIHLACQSLRTDECEMAVAGGVEVLLDESVYLLVSEAKAFSPDGKCHTFDEQANGFVPGEGCGVVLLKRLERALEDGDRIYGVVASTATNNDGHTMGITTPNIQAQKALVKKALSQNGISPATISYIEAHGTGTVIGDPIELKALTEVFRAHTNETGFCGVGCVKTNIGHLASAAGVAGFIKMILSLQHGQIAPTLNCDHPNPRFEFASSPFYPNTQLAPFPIKDGVRRAAVSAFGLGGTNCHIIADQFDPAAYGGYVPAKRSPEKLVFNRRRFWVERPAAPATETTAIPAASPKKLRPMLSLEVN